MRMEEDEVVIRTFSLSLLTPTSNRLFLLWCTASFFFLKYISTSTFMFSLGQVRKKVRLLNMSLCGDLSFFAIVGLIHCLTN